VSDERTAQDLFGGGAGLVWSLDDLDASALTASTGVDLGFDDDGASEPLGGGFGFGYGVNHFAPRHWHAVVCEQGFGLVFVDLHVDV
jgi:hypothetical protein